jgi:hypothetical protein
MSVRVSTCTLHSERASINLRNKLQAFIESTFSERHSRLRLQKEKRRGANVLQ